MTVFAAFNRWPVWGRLLWVAAAASAVAMLAIGLTRDGDGGGSGGSVASAPAVAACLDGAGGRATTNPDSLDTIAQHAGLGGVHVTMAGNAATVALERTAGDAARSEQTYRQFANGLRVPVDDILVREGAAVVVFDKAPTDKQRRMVLGCL